MTNPRAHTLSHELVEELERIPDGEKIRLCIQCGTCSASCPTAHAMDYSPRQIIAAMRAGRLDKVLKSDTAWLCASCYSCTVRCPAGIQFTDMMYALKRLGIKHGINPGDKRSAVMMRTFVEEVDRSGRNPEFLMMAKYYLRTLFIAPFDGLRDIGFGFRMWRKRRLQLRTSKIAGRDQLKAIARTLEANSK